MNYFERVTPESLGIHSQGILNFIQDVDKKNIELHSMMVIRHGKCCAAGWWKPYTPEEVHPLYSFSKSLTATAIGFAEQEGLLSLEERLIDIFPDESPAQPSENLQKATIHHLLIMGCGQETEVDWPSEDWIRDFLHHPFPYEPGTFYKYNTAGTNMLAAVLKRKTGQDVTEFLRPRLLDPLGIQNISCIHMPGRDSVEMGGAGMRLCTEDMAKFAYFLLRRGNWEGKQLLREEWFDRACTKQIETLGDSENHIKEWGNGYGYQCWMGSLPGSFRADGAYGQFGLVYPSLDMTVIFTSATEQTQSLIDSLMEHLIPAVTDEPLTACETSELLKHTLEQLSLAPCRGDRNPIHEELLQNKIFTADDSGICSSMETLIGGAGLFQVETGALEKMAFSFQNGIMTWKVWENGKEKELIASMNNDFAISHCDAIRYAASACWRNFQVLEMEVRRTSAISGARIRFRFGQDSLTLEADDTLVSAGGLGMFEKHTVPFTTDK